MNRCRAGDRKAWEALVQRYQRLVYTIVRRAGLDEHAAADVFQAVFVRLLEHLARIADPARLQAWIVTTARREVLLQLRRATRTVSMSRRGDTDEDDDGEDRDIADDALLPDEVLGAIQEQERVRRGLERLDPRCRALLDLLFTDDDTPLPYDAIARQLGMPIGSIGPTRARCLARLRGLIGPDHDDHA